MLRRRLHIFLVLCLLSAGEVTGQQKTRLTKHWEFLRGDLGGVWEAVRPVGKGNPESVPLWEKVSLPHCFNSEDAVDPDVNYYQGPGWYRTLLEVKNPYSRGRTLLHFEGAGQKTEVFVYTTKVGGHTGGYDEWTVDITSACEDFMKTEVCKKQFGGRVPISIRCDNSRDLQMIPSNLSDFTIYGGLYRYLNLVYVPALSFEKLFVEAGTDREGKKGQVLLKARFYNPDKIADSRIRIRLLDPLGKAVAQKEMVVDMSDREKDPVLMNFELRKPLLWSPSHPLLYTVEAQMEFKGGLSRHSAKVGFRNFQFVDKGPFKLNGQRLLLRGTHRHEDHAGTGAAMTEEMIRKEMQMIKDMGVNFIRLAHYQQSPIVLHLCDSLGIMVWEEIPWCRGGLGGEVYQSQAKRMLVNMIEQHYNHPSVIIWGLGNENDWPGDFPEFDKDRIRSFMQSLNDLAHQLDPSRKTAIRRCDFCSDIVDVYSPSIWAGWYRGIYTEYKEVSRLEFEKVKHFLHVEWGGDSHAMRHSESPDKALNSIKTGNGTDERAGDASLYGGAARVSKDGDWSESYICNLIDWHLKEQETMPWLTGSAYWPFKDFATPVRPENPVPYVNQKGVVERDFTPKEAYYVFQSYWTSKPMAHIYGHSWPIRWGDEGEEKMVKVYSNCDEAELFLNGKSMGVRKRNSQNFPAAGLHWGVPFKNGVNSLKVIARKGKSVVEDTLRFTYQTDKWGAPVCMVVKEIARNADVSTIEVTLKDNKNTICLDATNWIRFSLAGDGKMLDNRGTSSGSRLVQAYNGRAIIKVKLNQGHSVIGVHSPEIPTAFIDLK